MFLEGVKGSILQPDEPRQSLDIIKSFAIFIILKSLS